MCSHAIIMPSSQIKRVPDNFFQFKDFGRHPGAVRFYDILIKQSQIKRAPDGSFFGNPCLHFSVQKDTWRQPAGHRAGTGRTSGRDRSDIGQGQVGARTNIRRTSCRRLVTVQ